MAPQISKPRASDRKIEANRQNALRSTGPKTLRGKAFSRKNALKDGLFAQELFVYSVIKREDRRRFFKLHSGLRDAWQPEGKAEELEVEFIAVCWWKRARGLRCESAETRVAHDLTATQGHVSSPRQLLTPENKRLVLLLETAMEQIKTSGEVRPEFQDKINEDPCILRNWPRFEKEAEESVRQAEEHFAREVVEETDLPFTKVKPTKPNDPASRAKRARTLKYLTMHFAIQDILKWTQKQFEYVLDGVYDQQAIPNRDALDRIQRYSGMVERDLNRAYDRLERLQRSRKGEMVLPSLNVNVAGTHSTI